MYDRWLAVLLGWRSTISLRLAVFPPPRAEVLGDRANLACGEISIPDWGRTLGRWHVPYASWHGVHLSADRLLAAR